MLILNCFLLILFPFKLLAQIGSITGGCPFAIPQRSFNLECLFGHWYEYGKFIPGKDIFCECTHYEFEENYDYDIKMTKWTHHAKTNESTVRYAWLTMLGRNTLRSSKVSLAHNIEKGEYVVLGTDCDRYIILYHCEPNAGKNHKRYIFILTRITYPGLDTLLQIDDVLQNSLVLLPNWNISLTNQHNCPSYSDFERVSQYRESD